MALAARLGGNTLAAADMESAAWARAAAEAGVPYVVVRAISDGFDEDLPAFLTECLDESGAIDRTAVARRLVTHPSALFTLLKMRRRVHASAGQLASFMEKFLGEP
jgi:adenosylhomocysteine nucleosidase